MNVINPPKRKREEGIPLHTPAREVRAWDAQLKCSVVEVIYTSRGRRFCRAVRAVGKNRNGLAPCGGRLPVCGGACVWLSVGLLSVGRGALLMGFYFSDAVV